MDRRSTLAAVTGAVLTAGTLATVTAARPAGADETCTAWATLPARVTVTSRETHIHPRLVGTAGCDADTADNGATADWDGPGQDPWPQRWSAFGAREDVVIQPGLDRPGKYTISGGDVQVYDAQYERIPAHWRTTSTVVRFGARFTGVRSSRRTVSATLKHYSADGWRTSGSTKVSLQKRTSSGWRTVATHRASHGTVSFGHGAGRFRLVSAASATVWSAGAAVGSSRA